MKTTKKLKKLSFRLFCAVSHKYAAFAPLRSTSALFQLFCRFFNFFAVFKFFDAFSTFLPFFNFFAVSKLFWQKVRFFNFFAVFKLFDVIAQFYRQKREKAILNNTPSFSADFCSFASFLITCSFFNQKDGNF